MNKVLQIVCLLWFQTLFAQAQAPQITSPSSGATVPSTFNVSVAAFPTAASMWLEYRVANSGTVFTALKQSGTGPYTFTLSGLLGGTQYEIQARAFNAGGGTLGSSRIFVTTTAPLAITYPSNGATNLPVNFNVQVNAYPGASSALVQWRPVGGTYNATNQSVQAGGGPYTLPVSGLLVNTQYDLQVRALDANGILAETTLRITTTKSPQITSPSSGATVPSTFNVEVAAYAGAATMRLEYRIANSGSGFTTLQQSGTGPYTFTLSGLLGGTQYEIQARAFNAGGGTLGSGSIFVNTRPGLVVTFPSNNQTGLPLNFNVQVNAYPGASSALVQWRPVGGTYNATNQSVQAGGGPYTLPVSGLLVNTQYDLRVRALDANGILAETTLRITTTKSPQITSPADGATGLPSAFDVTVAAYPGAASMWLEYRIANSGSGFTTLQQSGTGPYTFTLSGLLGGTQYEIQARAFNAGGGTLGSGSIFVNIAENPYVIAINGQSINENSLLYLNQFQYTLTSQTIGGTVNYRWEFSKTNTFDSFITFNTGNNTVLTLHAGQLESGERYYVRIASVKSNGAENVIKPVRSFYNALHPTVMYRPVGDINTTTTGLVSFHARNATEAIYQVATDPSFSTESIVNIPGPGPGRESALDPANPVPGQVVYIGRRSRVGINGRFVDITDPDNYLSSGPQWIYDYIAGLIPEQQYYIRMKLARRGSNGDYLQTGYWYNVQTIRATGIPPRSNVVTYIQGGPTNVPVISPEIFVKDDPNYVETRYLLQISEDVNFSTFVYNTLEQAPKPYLVNIFRDLPTLKYNTVYYVRSGAYTINDPAGPSEPRWQNTFFKTVAAPARIAFDEEVQGAQTNSQYVVAPNPFAQSTRLIVAPGSKEVVVRVTDMVGRVVEEVTTSGGESIDLGSTWKRGMYIIQIIDATGEQEIKTFKILKQ